jgi:hypothetical protein
MTEGLVTISIRVQPVSSGWRAIVYQDGRAVKMSPASNDRDVALLYARAMQQAAGHGEFAAEEGK